MCKLWELNKEKINSKTVMFREDHGTRYRTLPHNEILDIIILYSNRWVCCFAVHAANSNFSSLNLLQTFINGHERAFKYSLFVLNTIRRVKRNKEGNMLMPFPFSDSRWPSRSTTRTELSYAMDPLLASLCATQPLTSSLSQNESTLLIDAFWRTNVRLPTRQWHASQTSEVS